MTERLNVIKLIARAYADRLRAFRSYPYPFPEEVDTYRRAVNLRLFLDEQLDGNAYSYVTKHGWNFDRFREAVWREFRKINCGPIRDWEKQSVL